MKEPRTVAGRAALSGTRPHIRRAFGQTIVAIETEAVAPYLHALQEAERLLELLAAADPAATWSAANRRELVRQARAARQLAQPLVAPNAGPDAG